jgi:2-methylcitrate dehydratase PrpD
MNEKNTKSVDQLSRGLAEFTTSLQLDSLPGKVIDNAKIAILDCLGVAVLAASQEIGKTIVKFCDRKN